MTTLAIAAVGIAVFGFFAWHIAHAVKDELDVRRRKDEIKQIKKDLDYAIQNGMVASIGQLRQRLCELED